MAAEYWLQKGDPVKTTFTAQRGCMKRDRDDGKIFRSLSSLRVQESGFRAKFNKFGN
ncbi:MAG: hypothetical protein OXC26_19805 [Albidovulum sp.]|nr:hypothetical protein [Albidovulum sp.]